MKKLKTLWVVLVTALLISVTALTGCAKTNYELAVENGYTGSLTEWLDSLKAKSNYELALEQGFQGTEAEWLASLMVGDIGLEELYEFYKANNGDKTFEDFIALFFSESSDPVQGAIQTMLRSAVSIRADFNYKLGKSVTSAGAGVILDISATGVTYIITNYHVVYDYDASVKISNKISVAPYGKEFFGDSGSLNLSVSAEFVGGSPSKDIAVIKTVANDTFKNTVYRAAEIADSNGIIVGEAAIAVGNPEGVGLSATRGVVNVDSEYIEMEKLDSSSGTEAHRVMRVDAAINSGNSGGGLFNRYGKLIGIVNAKAVDDGIDNIGYAIPSNVAVGIAKSIMDGVTYGGNFVKYTIGVTTEISGSRAVLEDGAVRVKEELKVTAVESGKPGSGVLAKDDILVSAQLGDLAEVEITRNFTLSDYLYAARAGDTLKLTVLRKSVLTEVSLTVKANSYSVI